MSILYYYTLFPAISQERKSRQNEKEVCVVNRCDPFLEKIKSRIEHNAFESLEVERSGTKRLSKNGAVYVASFSARS